METDYDNYGLCTGCYEICELVAILVEDFEVEDGKARNVWLEGLCENCEEFYRIYFGWTDEENFFRNVKFSRGMPP